MKIFLCQEIDDFDLYQEVKRTNGEADIFSSEHLEQIGFVVELGKEVGNMEREILQQMSDNPKMKLPNVSLNDDGSTSYYFQLRNPVKIKNRDQLYRILNRYFRFFSYNIFAVIHSLNKDIEYKFYLLPEDCCGFFDSVDQARLYNQNRAK